MVEVIPSQPDRDYRNRNRCCDREMFWNKRSPEFPEAYQIEGKRIGGLALCRLEQRRFYFQL
jgi:hypothetical protein